ncbi:hypothetical protein FUAX_40420 (plasmid) [Fulvitalea axinellae]|uniref:Lipocalin-like domain-containing protein n=1 Tax=Fulvitalea axinellae TaxID=1182444 RepID=A0AAU9DGD7_9BACT|nr:hypothetical protein FUAX_40420 [Fulvitalea axinellae]
MKKTFQYLLAVLVAGTLAWSCGSSGGDDPAPQEVTGKQLSKTPWTLQRGQVTVNGTDVTSHFSNMSVTMTYSASDGGGNITTQGDNGLFTGSTGWIYSNKTNANSIRLVGSQYINEAVQIDVTDTTFTMTFSAAGVPPIQLSRTAARTAGIDGTYFIKFKK